MDFAEPWQASAYQPLDPAHLPPLFVAWNQSMGTPSDVAHSEVRARWEAGDPGVRNVMQQFASLARAGRAAFDEGRAAETWPTLMRRAFELRASIWNITSIDQTLVQTGEHLGAGVAFAGSGGAVVGCVRDASELAPMADAYASVGAGFVVIAR